MNLTRLLFPVVALCLVGAATIGVQSSGATFTDASSYGSAVGAANDWTPPTVSMTSPGAMVSGTITISAQAADARGGVVSVEIQFAPAGTNAWTSVCTDTSSPYACAVDTRGVPDGSYELRAIARDDSGYSATSETVSTRVANDASVSLADPGDNLRGQVTLEASVSALPGGARFTFAYAPTDTSSWTTICAQSSSWTTSASCTWNTSRLTDTYDVRVVASSTTGGTYTDVQTDRSVDNTAPTGVSVTVPGSPLRGTATVVVDGDDDDSGVDTGTSQYRRQGTSSWIDCGTYADLPGSCPFDSSRVVDGTYEFRALVTDLAGNQATSPTVTRTVDNTVSAVSITSPAAGSTVRGASVSVTVAASSNRGVTSVRVETRATGSSSWIAVCTDTTAPYACTADTTHVSTGSFDIRAVMTDGTGGTTTSAIVAVTIDNQPLRALDVQASSSSSLGRPSTGDKLVLTYSEKVDTSSIKSGWNGSATTIAPTFNDRRASDSVDGGRDNVSFSGTNLGAVSFVQNYLNNRKSVTFAGSTMVASTQVVDGVQVTVVTVTLGNPSGSVRSSNASGAMVWTPASRVRSVDGQSCSTSPVTESGSSDKDL